MPEQSDSPQGKFPVRDVRKISATNSLTDTEAWGQTESTGKGRFPPGLVFAERYRIVSLLGQGGMGTVYRADDLKLAQPVALKFLPASGSKAIDNLLDEVRLGRKISHPNVCRIHDIIEIDGQNFIAMEYVEGEDLASLLRRIGPLPTKKGMDLAGEICSGLAAAHDLGIVHRDLKPGNIMIDGRGHARITDFGLATLMKDFRTRETITGTPVYMAPEQIREGQVSPQTDIYSLGLVLYEMFTGERYVKGGTLAEIQAFHTQARKAISNLPVDLDPLVVKMIADCLATDPEQRPSSVRNILSQIPVGDPIEAAIAEGETPSPEMVAAALVVGDLKPKTAWAFLLAAVSLLAVITFVSGGRLAPFEKSPAILAEKAREIIAKTGYDFASVDRVHAFSLEPTTLSYFGGQLSSTASGSEQMSPDPLQFVYRQSPRPMIPSNRTGIVTQQDPPLTLPGMAMIHFDSQGRLVGFQIVPEPGSDSSEQEADWSLLLEEAGLQADDLKPAPPEWNPPLQPGTGRAWIGYYSGFPDVPVRIEAAGYDGNPTFFRVSGIQKRTDDKQKSTDEKQENSRFYKWVHLILILTGICIPLPIARRNYRLGRADRKGSMRLAVFVFLVSGSSYLLRIHHAADPQEYILVRNALGQGLFFSVMTWVLYTALEPYLRRRFPHTLTGWKRLLDGRFRDPLVGREVLLGTLAGLVIVTCPFIVDLFTGWRGTLTSQLIFYLGSLKSVPFAMGNYLWLLCRPIFEAFLFVLLFLLFRVMVRNKHVAHISFVVLIGFAHAGATGLIHFPATVPVVFLAIALMVLVFLRWGFLAFVLLFAVNLLLLNMPITVDVESWYFGRSLLVLLTILAFAVYGFRTSLSGKPALGKLLLED